MSLRAKRSNPEFSYKTGLLRFARNDIKNVIPQIFYAESHVFIKYTDIYCTTHVRIGQYGQWLNKKWLTPRMDIQGYGIPDDHLFCFGFYTYKDQGGELGRACRTKGETNRKDR